MARQPMDFYETPPWQTHALFDRADIYGRCLDCCVGDGAIVKASNARDDGDRRQWITNDIDPNREAVYHYDATDSQLWDVMATVDYVITNWPFNVAFKILQRAMSSRKVLGGVISICRLSFPEPTIERGPYFSESPPQGQIILPRWKYDPESKGSDSVTTAWMHWQKQGGTELFAPAIQIVPSKPSHRRTLKDGEGYVTTIFD